MPSNLIKVSGLINDHQERILTKFTKDYGVSKAKAMGMLLELWEMNDYPCHTPNTVNMNDLENAIEKVLESKLKDLIPTMIEDYLSKVSSEIVTNTNPTQLTEDESVKLPDDNPSQEVSNDDAPVANLEVMEVKKDDLNPYVKNLEGASEVKSEVVSMSNSVQIEGTDIEEENKPNDEEVEGITPKPVNNGNNEPKTEVKEDKPKKRGRKHELNENGLTEVQQKAMDNIPNLPTGKNFSYNGLAKALEVSRSVLDKFEQWKKYFEATEKDGGGYDYKKL